MNFSEKNFEYAENGVKWIFFKNKNGQWEERTKES